MAVFQFLFYFISKSKKALHAISLIRKYFTPSELLSIITSNYLYILYYNADVWLLSTLSPLLKQKLLSASAAPLKLCTRIYDRFMSFETLHSVNNRATPLQFTTYRHAILLHKYYNDDTKTVTGLTYFSTNNSTTDAIQYTLWTQNHTKLAITF